MDGIDGGKIEKEQDLNLTKHRDHFRAISDVFMQSNLYQTYECKNQFFWNTVDEMKLNMYNIMQSISMMQNEFEVNKHPKIVHANFVQVKEKSILNSEKNKEKYRTEENKLASSRRDKENKSRDLKDRTIRQDLVNNSFASSKITKNEKSVDFSHKQIRAKIVAKDRVEINLNTNILKFSNIKDLKAKRIETNTKDNRESLMKISNVKNQKTKLKIIPLFPNHNSHNITNTNTKVISKIKKSPAKNEIKTNLTQKENVLKPVENHHNNRLKSIEIDLNCQEEEVINNIPLVDEEIIRENLKKNENKDICLALEDLQIPAGYYIDSQGNQLIEISEENKNEIEAK